MTSEATRRSPAATRPATRATPGSATATRRTSLISEPDRDQFDFRPHNCFACGTLNANGLQMDIHVEPGRSWSELEIDRRFEGWESIVHGGIVCTILDEVMAWALVAEDNWGLTARLSVEFKKPVTLGMPVRGEGWIVRSRRRLVETEAHLVDIARDVVVATATGLYVAADDERKRELQARYGFRRLPASAAVDR